MTAQKDRVDRIPQNETYNFIAFSQDEAYRQASVDLLARVFPSLPSTFYHVDMATGTGLVPQVLGKMAREGGKTARIIGVDPDAFAIQNAQDSVAHMNSEQTRFKFLQGYGQDSKALLEGVLPPEGADSVSIHDAIHEIPGEDAKRETLAGLYAVSKPGALFTLNSAFTSAANTREFGLWKAAVVNEVGKGRDKSREAIKTHTPDEYTQMIKDAGFLPVFNNIRTVELSRDALVAISQYPEFTTGMFRDIIGQEDIPFKDKAEISVRALDNALKRMDRKGLPRVWYEVIAQKPLASTS